jgi:hypothetical protein
VDLAVALRLRGFLVVFDLAQIINLVWLSFKTQCVVLSAFVVVGFNVASVSLDELLAISESGPNHLSSSTLFISEYFILFSPVVSVADIVF